TQGRGNQTVDLAGDFGVDTPLVLGRSLAEGAISDFRIFNREVNETEARFLQQWPAIQAALAQDKTELTESARSALLTYFLQKEHEPYRKLAREQNDLDTEVRAIARRGSVTLVLE